MQKLEWCYLWVVDYSVFRGVCAGRWCYWHSQYWRMFLFLNEREGTIFGKRFGSYYYFYSLSHINKQWIYQVKIIRYSLDMLLGGKNFIHIYEYILLLFLIIKENFQYLSETSYFSRFIKSFIRKSYFIADEL